MLKLLYLLSAVTIFLPWFTYRPEIMGYCWGYAFLGWLLPPMAVVAAALFKPSAGRLLCALGGLCAVLQLAVVLLAMGFWQDVRNIQAGFHWTGSTALPGYWLAVLLFFVFCIAFETEAVKGFRSNT